MTGSAQGDTPGAAGSTPRPAATVVLVRGTPTAAPEVLMVRRSAKSPFMPSTYVFPGGRVDRADGPAGSDAAFDAAARRECREEVGLDLAGQLRWFDTWITPSAEPRRYEARFFLAALAPGAGAHARADDHETHDETWAPIDLLLARWEALEIDLPPPTLGTLLRMRGKSRDEVLTLADVDPRPPILPKWIPLQGVHHVVLPHDPGYAALPGDAAPAPPRVRDFPRRFRREERRWVPLHD